MFQKKWVVLKIFHDGNTFNTSMFVRRGSLENLLDEFRKDGEEHFQCSDGVIVIDNSTRESLDKPKGHTLLTPKVILLVPYFVMERKGIHGIEWCATNFSRGLLDQSPIEETEE